MLLTLKTPRLRTPMTIIFFFNSMRMVLTSVTGNARIMRSEEILQAVANIMW